MLGIVAAFALVFVAFPRAATASTVCAAPRCRDVSIPLPSGVKVPDNRVRVLLPSGYNSQGGRRYPVVYVFHGVGDTYTAWTEQTDIVAFTRRMKAIIVMPDAGKGPEAGWHSDWKDGSRQWETFHTGVLVRYIDRHFRTLGARHRGALGTSMGGFGAMSYAARHKGLYQAAASLSGLVDTMYLAPASGPFYNYAGEGFRDQSLGTPSERVWGNQTADEKQWRAHNPTDLAPKLKGVWLYVTSVNGAPGGAAGDDPSRPHSYLIGNYVWQTNLTFTGALDDAGVRYTSDFHSGYHHWPYVQLELHKVLPKLVDVID